MFYTQLENFRDKKTIQGGKQNIEEESQISVTPEMSSKITEAQCISFMTGAISSPWTDTISVELHSTGMWRIQNQMWNKVPPHQLLTLFIPVNSYYHTHYFNVVQWLDISLSGVHIVMPEREPWGRGYHFFSYGWLNLP